MERKIVIKFGLITLEALLNEGIIAQAIWEALPIESVCNLWGNEIYFEIPFVSAQADDVTTKIGLGDIAYWSMGRAICIFFGSTPLSKGDEIVSVAPVSIIGKITGDIEYLKQVEEREIVIIKRI